ncbi:MAG: CDP-alcohol phosphatidyltransferase family protein [Myxococcota bacterium]
MRASEWIPDGLSLSRVGMAALVWLRPTDTGWLLGFLAAAAVSDLLDGWLARRLRAHEPHKPSRAEERGAWLDPVCDKIFVLSVLLMLLHVGTLSLTTVALLATRDWLVFSMFLLVLAVPRFRRKELRYRARALGKLTTVAQFAAVSAHVLVPAWAGALVVTAVVLGVAAAADYAWRAWRTLRMARVAGR